MTRTGIDGGGGGEEIGNIPIWITLLNCEWDF
jgi:hypothetical protein